MTNLCHGIVPVNPWPPGKQLKKIGDMMLTNINIILEPISVPVFMGILGWSRDELDLLLTEVRKEVADTNMHAFMTLYGSTPPIRSWNPHNS